MPIIWMRGTQMVSGLEPIYIYNICIYIYYIYIYMYVCIWGMIWSLAIVNSWVDLQVGHLTSISQRQMPCEKWPCLSRRGHGQISSETQWVPVPKPSTSARWSQPWDDGKTGNTRNLVARNHGFSVVPLKPWIPGESGVIWENMSGQSTL